MRWPSDAVRCAAVALGLFAFTACGSSLEERLAGSYVFDREVHRAQARARLIDQGATADESGDIEARRARDAEIEKAAYEEGRTTMLLLELREGGTFRLTFRYGDERGSATGAWEAADDALRLETRVEHGRTLKTPRAATLRPTAQGLLLEGEGVPVPIPFRRRRAGDPREL